MHRTKIKNRQYDYKNEANVDKIKESDCLSNTPTTVKLIFNSLEKTHNTFLIHIKL